MSKKRNFLQIVESGLEKFGQRICDIGIFFKKHWRWSFELRKVVMAAPVVILAVAIANECRNRLPETVGLTLQISGSFGRYIQRDTAIMVTTAITGICLLFMFVSRKTVYPWLISLMSLLLPVMLILINTFPA